MKLITEKNCVLASFAMSLDVTTDELLLYLGHDGKEIVCPNEHMPNDLRSFHPQEMVDVCLSLRYWVIEIDRFPKSLHGQTVFCDYEYMDDYRFRRHLVRGSGVLFGKTSNGIGHACAWNNDTRQIYDPRGHRYSYNQRKTKGFEPEYFFLVTKV